jgi:hypothetical protein
MSDHQHSGPTLIIGLRLIGVVHGIFVGLGGLIPLLYILLGSADQDWRAGLASKIALTLVAAAGFLTMYAFFARNRSGRYLGILCSGLLFLSFSVPLAAWWLFGSRGPVAAPLVGALYVGARVLVPIGMITICLSPAVRGAMNR